MLNFKSILQMKVVFVITRIFPYFLNNLLSSMILLNGDNLLIRITEVESSRTSLASRTSSRTHFEVLGLGLEALGPRKLPCPRLEDSTIFEPLKFCWKTPETSRKICKDLFCFPQLEHRLSQAGFPPIEISPMTKM